MLDRLKREGFATRLKDTFGLVRSTLTVFGQDADIMKPIIGMMIMRTIVSAAIVFGIVLIVFGAMTESGSVLFGVLLILLGAVLSPVSLFYDAFQRAKVTALSYDVARGQDATIPNAKARIKPVKGTLFLVGLIDSLVASAKSKSNDSKGIMGIITSILVSVLAEVWDLVSNFLMPAVVIEQKGPKAVVGELKELKRNVPAAIVGVLGFDAFGSLAKTMTAGIFVVLGLVGIALPIFIFGMGTISFFAALITAGLIVVGSSIIGKLVIGAKSVYFTLFYVALVRPHEISPQMRDTCTNLLPAEVAEAAGATARANTEPNTGGSNAAQPDGKLHDLVSKLRARDGTDEQIRAFLIQKGFSTADVDRALTNPN